MTPQQENTNLDDILNEVVAKYDRPTREALISTVRRHPEHEREVVDFFAAWAEQEMLPPPSDISPKAEQAMIDRAMSHVQNLLHARQSTGSAQSAEKVESSATVAKAMTNALPVTSLVEAAKKAGLSAAELAQACDLDHLLVAKLERRVIEFHTIPKRLIATISSWLKVSIEAVTAFLDSSIETADARTFLSRDKLRPLQKETFAAAVERSTLSPDKKRRWLDEVEAMK
jgi:transcriptional regulator with XRE-family HTH domain